MMKYRYFSILYLLLVPVYIIRPSLPYIEYILNKEYIEKNLCVEKNNPENTCHGKCYLHEQLKKQGELPDVNTNNNNKNVQDKKMDDHLKGILIFPQLFRDDVLLLSGYFIPSTAVFITDIFVPPKY